MMRRIVLLAVLAAGCNAVVVAPAGKGPDAGTTGGRDGGVAVDSATSVDGGPMLMPAQYVTQIDMKYCDAAFACQASYPNNTGLTFAQDWGTSPANCYTNSDNFQMPAQVAADVTAGVITFNPVHAAACLAGFAYSCTTFFQSGETGPVDCSTALVGSIPDGGTCKVDYECALYTSGCNPNTNPHKCQKYGTF